MQKLVAILSVFLLAQNVYADDASSHVRTFMLSDLPKAYQHATPHSYADFLAHHSVNIKLTNALNAKDNNLNLVETDKSLDFAIADAGYYMVTQAPFTNDYVYSRFGNLMLNVDGELTNNYGFNLFNTMDGNKIVMPSAFLQPAATTMMTITGNIDHNAQATSSVLQVYDSLGRELEIIVSIESSATNTYSLSIGPYSIDKNPQSYAKGYLYFDTKGQFVKATGLDHVTIPSADGSADPINVQLTFDAFTNFSGANAIKMSTNGFAAGSLNNVYVEPDGEVFAWYSNDIRVMLAQIWMTGEDEKNLVPYQPYFRAWVSKKHPHVMPAIYLGYRLIPGYLDKNEMDDAAASMKK